MKALLAKCANPDCQATFHYFRSGRIFRLDLLKSGEPHPSPAAEHDLPEYFWLCGECARRLTLVYDPQAGIVIRPLDSGPEAPSLPAA